MPCGTAQKVRARGTDNDYGHAMHITYLSITYHTWRQRCLDCCAGLLCVVGTYEPSVELLLLETQYGGGKGTPVQFQRLGRLQEEAICPVLHSAGLPASAGLTDVPESLLLLEGATHHSQMQVLAATDVPSSS